MIMLVFFGESLLNMQEPENNVYNSFKLANDPKAEYNNIKMKDYNFLPYLQIKFLTNDA